MIQQNYFQICS